MPQIYSDPAGGQNSTIGNQLRTDFIIKKALIEAKKEQFFGQLADTVSMPKNMGKTIKVFQYLPLLDDANINDQGLDAAGLAVNQTVSVALTRKDGSIPDVQTSGTYVIGSTVHFVGEGATAALAAIDAQTKANQWMEQSTNSGGLGLTLVGGTEPLKYFDGANTTDGLADALGFVLTGGAEASSAATTTLLDALAVPESGNLYGSSKDVGTITAKLPVLSETGGRVNRVGFKRRELEGTISKFGFFDEWTQESLDFDTDADLEMHINREMIMAANEITEDALQIDLLNGAGVVRFAGDALKTSELTGATGDVDQVTYNDLVKLSIDLDNNRTPKSTKIITGTRMIDTKTINAARIMYIGSELIPMVKKMADSFALQAFVSVEKYASATTLAVGEIGSIDQFRIVVVPEMMRFEGAGAAEGTNGGFRVTNAKYDVFPMLVVGSESFTTIGFQTDGKTVKFKIKVAKPGSTESFATDPFGEIGFMSIKWYYGSLILRPERIAVIKTVAEW